MDPIAVDIRLIRAVLGAELRVAPGRALMARVVSADAWGRGTLSIAGALIEAKLPKDVQAGQELRLTVRHVSAEQVVLGLSDQSLPPPAAAPAVPLPGGGTFRVTERDAESAPATGSTPGRHTLALVYEAPALGAVDLRFELDPQSLRVSAVLAAGDPVARAQDAAAELREALSGGLGRPVTVEIDARHEPLDVYA
jgi:ribosomal 50S subunit-recycling heat shock protein